jgi:hypothetical protein
MAQMAEEAGKQADQTNKYQVYGDQVIEQLGCQQYQDTEDQRDQRLNGNNIEMHEILPVCRIS